MAEAVLEVEYGTLFGETSNRLLHIRNSGLLRVSLDLRYIDTAPYAVLVRRGQHYLGFRFEAQQESLLRDNEQSREYQQRLSTTDVAADVERQRQPSHAASVANQQQQRDPSTARTVANKPREQKQQEGWDEIFGYLRPGQQESSAFRQRVLWACMVQKATILHVSGLLRLPLLLLTESTAYEDDRIPSSVLFAVIGELDCAYAGKLYTDENQLETQTSQEVSSDYIHDTLEQIVGFLEEAGRDRLTYLKEAVSIPDAPIPLGGLFMTPTESSSRSRGGSRCASALGQLAERKYLTSLCMYDHPHRGDACLERMLQSGSLPLLMTRLHTLMLGNRTKALENIRWAICRQAPFMNKMRQLIFTRMAQLLCSQVICPSLPIASRLMRKDDGDDEEEDPEEREQKEKRRQRRLAAAVLSALVDSGTEMLSSDGVSSPTQRRELVGRVATLCINTARTAATLFKGHSLHSMSPYRLCSRTQRFMNTFCTTA